jgi:hypothetical protein
MFLSLLSQPCFTLVTHAIPKPFSQAILLPCYMYPLMMTCSLFSYPLSEDLYVVLSWPLPFFLHQSCHFYSPVIDLALLTWNIFSITDLRNLTQTYYLHWGRQERLADVSKVQEHKRLELCPKLGGQSGPGSAQAPVVPGRRVYLLPFSDRLSPASVDAPPSHLSSYPVTTHALLFQFLPPAQGSSAIPHTSPLCFRKRSSSTI